MKIKPIDEALRDFQILFRMPVSLRKRKGGSGRGFARVCVCVCACVSNKSHLLLSSVPTLQGEAQKIDKIMQVCPPPDLFLHS